MKRSARGSIGIFFFVIISGCAEPPSKEMNQAQGAIETARAAGAEHYAAQELGGAVDALQRSEQAVTQKDYRLALSLAIDSRERAHSAAKAAVDARSRARGDAERVVAEASMRLSRARERLTDPVMTRLPRRTTDDSTQALDAAHKDMQEARAALSRDEYSRSLELANAASARIAQVEITIEKLAGPAPPRKRR